MLSSVGGRGWEKWEAPLLPYSATAWSPMVECCPIEAHWPKKTVLRVLVVEEGRRNLLNQRKMKMVEKNQHG